jgi:hypothetical protein
MVSGGIFGKSKMYCMYASENISHSNGCSARHGFVVVNALVPLQRIPCIHRVRYISLIYLGFGCSNHSDILVLEVFSVLVNCVYFFTKY